MLFICKIQLISVKNIINEYLVALVKLYYLFIDKKGTKSHICIVVNKL